MDAEPKTSEAKQVQHDGNEKPYAMGINANQVQGDGK
jgi:hypothetical protein